MRAAVLAVLVLLSAAAAHAAQYATVIVDQAAIRESPSFEARIIETKAASKKIRVSSFAKDGWYKIKSDAGAYGWIWQKDITLAALESDVKAANLDLPERSHERRGSRQLPWFFFRLSGGVSPLVGIVEANSGHLHLTLGGAIDAGVKLSDDLRFMVRLQSLSNGSTLGGSTNEADVLPGLTAAMVGLEQDISAAETHDWSVSLNAGVNLSTNVGIQYADGTIFTVSGTGYAFLAAVNYKYYFKNWISMVFEGGFFWDYILQTEIPEYASSHVNIYGPLLQVGLQLSL